MILTISVRKARSSDGYSTSIKFEIFLGYGSHSLPPVRQKDILLFRVYLHSRWYGSKTPGFKPLISVHHIGPAQHNTVIFHNYGPETFVLKHTGNFFSKVFTPRCAIRRKTDIATDIMRLRNNLGIGTVPAMLKATSAGG